MFLQLGSIGPLPAILIGLVVLAVVILLARIVLKFAWRLVILAAIAVGVLYLLGLLGITFV